MEGRFDYFLAEKKKTKEQEGKGVAKDYANTKFVEKGEKGQIWCSCESRSGAGFAAVEVGGGTECGASGRLKAGEVEQEEEGDCIGCIFWCSRAECAFISNCRLRWACWYCWRCCCACCCTCVMPCWTNCAVCTLGAERTGAKLHGGVVTSARWLGG